MQVGEQFLLQFGWRVQGAHMPFVATAMQWRIDGAAASTAIDFTHTFATPGDRTISLSVADFLGRVHEGSAVVRVLSTAEMDAMMGSLAAINLSLLSAQPIRIFASGFK